MLRRDAPPMAFDPRAVVTIGAAGEIANAKLAGSRA
jgi:hypothetical protein